MKKTLFSAIIFIAGLYGNLCAVHNLIFRNAGDITAGILPNARLDVSSVTLQGNASSFTEIGRRIDGLAGSTGSILIGAVTSYAPAFATSQSTNALVSGASFRSSIVLSSHIANETILSEDILNGAIAAEDIADNTITGAKIGQSTIFSENIGSNTILAVDVANEVFAGWNATRVSTANILLNPSNSNYFLLSSGTALGMTDGLINTATNPVDWSKLKGVPSGFSDGIDSIDSSAFIRSSAVIVGPLGSTGVDIASNTIDGWNAALRMLGASGLTTSTTGQGTIHYNRGNYRLDPVSDLLTVPAGIKLIGDTSATWSLLSAGKILNVYGKIEGMAFNSAGFAVGNFVNFSSGSRVSNCIFLGLDNANTGSVDGHSFVINNVHDIIVENCVFHGWRGQDGLSIYGDDGAFRIKNSSNVIFRYNTINSANNKNGGSGLVVHLSSAVQIYGNSWKNLTGSSAIMLTGGNTNITIEDNYFTVEGASMVATNGVIVAQSAVGSVTSSTGIFINNNKFFTFVNAGVNLILTQGTAPPIGGLVISGNTSVSSLPNALTFIGITAQASGTVIKGNTANRLNAFISDSGVGTVYIGNDNFLNGIEQ